MKFTLPSLPYPYDAFEPYIDKQTMEIHHTKHHQAYVNQLNAVVEKNLTLESYSLEQLINGSLVLSPEIATLVRNNGGGHYNHTFFWKQMNVNGSKEPVGALAPILHSSFDGYETFKQQFEAAAKSVFGSGWAWLCIDQNNKLTITTTPNQDCPLLYNVRPIMGLDVWEHAYYLKYQNRRADYIAAWWQLLDWQQVEAVYRQIVEIGK